MNKISNQHLIVAACVLVMTATVVGFVSASHRTKVLLDEDANLASATGESQRRLSNQRFGHPDFGDKLSHQSTDGDHFNKLILGADDSNNLSLGRDQLGEFKLGGGNKTLD